MELGFGRGHQAELRHIGLAEDDEAGALEARGEVRIVRPRQHRHETRALARGDALRERQNVLEQERHAAEDALGQFAFRGLAGAFVVLVDDRVELGIEGLGAGNGFVEQLARLDFLLGHQLGQAYAVILRIVAYCHSPSPSYVEGATLATQGAGY